MSAKAKRAAGPLVEGDRIVVKFDAGEVMGYFLSYYNDVYACVALDDQSTPDGPGGDFGVERRRISKAPAESAPPL